MGVQVSERKVCVCVPLKNRPKMFRCVSVFVYITCLSAVGMSLFGKI